MFLPLWLGFWKFSTSSVYFEIIWFILKYFNPFDFIFRYKGRLLWPLFDSHSRNASIHQNYWTMFEQNARRGYQHRRCKMRTTKPVWNEGRENQSGIHQSLYISHALSNFCGTKIEIWLVSSRLAILKKIWADYEQTFEGTFFHVFMAKKIIFLNIVFKE